jgi:hypothetical protein
LEGADGDGHAFDFEQFLVEVSNFHVLLLDHCVQSFYLFGEHANPVLEVGDSAAVFVDLLQVFLDLFVLVADDFQLVVQFGNRAGR